MEGVLILLALGTIIGGTLADDDGGASEADYRAAFYAMSMGRDEVPPVGNGTSPITVRIGLNLITLSEVDEEHNEVDVVTWMEYEWTDKRLAWGHSDSHEGYGIDGDPQAVMYLTINSNMLWTPDITLYNSVKAPEIITPQEVVVVNDGVVFYNPGIRYRFACDLADVNKHEGANCTMKFGSWANNGFIIDVDLRSTDGVRMDEYMVNPQYDVIGTSAVRNVKHYACCEEPYPDLEFKITIRKKGRSWFSRG